jgi:hypothetical protein
MSNSIKQHKLLLLAASVAVLAGCSGAEEIASPGSGGDVNITVNNTTPPPPPPPPPPEDTLVQPAAGCPTIDEPVGLTDLGTITGPTGTWRNCELPARFTRSSTLTKVPGLLYSMGGRVDVGTDQGAVPAAGQPSVTLTIQPGVIVYASTGVSWLAVNRGNRINAVGTPTQPIIFTSRDNVLGLASDSSQGQWGGIVLLGRAPITDCNVAPNAPPGSATCERQTEGAIDPAFYGGATPTDNSGTMRYVQIRYSGFVLSGDSELQALTPGGTGSGTTLEYIQSHNSSDDGIEFFGGTTAMKYAVVTGADDDSLDTDVGHTGPFQYVIVVQKPTGNADSIIELDSANALEDQTPRTHLKVANFTFIHTNPATGNRAAVLMRGQADATLVNGVISSPIACLRLNGANILTTNPAIDKIGPPVFRSVAMQCGPTKYVGTGGVTEQQVADTFNVAGNGNNDSFTTTLTNLFVNGANESAFAAIDPKTVDARFDTTSYVGAVRDANDTWYAGWTCNSSYANFGSTSTSCTTLPVP